MKKIKLRGHHLLCIQGYQGYGYDKIFEKNLDKIFKLIKDDLKIKKSISKTNEKPSSNYLESKHNKSKIQIKLVLEEDEICLCCPNLNDLNECQNTFIDSKIKNKDREVLNKTKLDINKYYPSSEIFKIVNESLKTKKDVKNICGSCSWQEKCLWFKRLGK